MNAREDAWKRDGACRELPVDVFYPDPTDRTANARAVAVCSGCPVREECLLYATRNRERFGVWGGQTEADRHKRPHSSKRLPPEPVERPCRDCARPVVSPSNRGRPLYVCDECRRMARIDSQARWRSSANA